MPQLEEEVDDQSPLNDFKDSSKRHKTMVVKYCQQPGGREAKSIYQIRKQMESWEALSDTEREEYEPILKQVSEAERE